MCSQVKLILDKLKEDDGEISKDEMFKASKDWFSRFKSHRNLHSIAESGEAEALIKMPLLAILRNYKL